MRDNFAALILTHGRADNVITEKTLRKLGYTGRIVYVIDNEDDQADRYYARYGHDDVVMFDKREYSKHLDTMDNFGKRNVILFARNAAFDIARDLGLEYFLELDDDYTDFEYRYRDGDKLLTRSIHDLDAFFEAMLQWLDDTGALTVAIAQGGDLIGGVNASNFSAGVIRKAMNSFFCRTDRRVDFIGTLNEDVNMYTTEGQRGKLIMTYTHCCLVQKETQSNKGGMTNIYVDNGTYLKSFYSVIASPSCVKISMMGDTHKRVHHSVNWDRCAVKIINEKYKKRRDQDAQRTASEQQS